MRNDIEAAMLILEKLGNLDGRENLAACRHEIIETHRLLGDAMEKLGVDPDNKNQFPT